MLDVLVELEAHFIQGAALRQANLKVAKEGLETLRTDIKYLQFDLEATKRERDELKQ